MRKNLEQFIRFGMVGVVNTGVYYAFYRVWLLILPYLAAHVLAWALATLISFYLNAYFTFKVRPTLKKLLAFPLSSLVNLAISTVVSAILVSGMDVSDKWGTLIGGIIAVPFTFLVVRLIFVRPAASTPAPAATAGESPAAAPEPTPAPAQTEGETTI